MTETRNRTDGQTHQGVVEALARPLGRPEATSRTHATEPRGLTILPESQFYEGRFGRLFRNLPRFLPTPDAITALAQQMVGPVEEPVGGSGGGANPELDNPTIPAGYTYVGQFIDHDITFDPVSTLDRTNDPDGLHNFRTPRLDLDSIYGTGPDDQPFLYDGNGRFVVDRSREHRGQLIDLQRALRPDGDGNLVPTVALIGDPRNDENVLIAHLHLTFLLFHNAVMDALEDGQFSEHLFSTRPEDRFREAQRIVRWHYQRAVVDDFLRRVCGDVVDDVLPLEPLVGDGDPVPHYTPKFYQPKKQAYMPVEFSVAAYRFGHSMIRARYQLNTSPVRNVEIFVADPASSNPLGHLGGHRALPDFWRIEWKRFFQFQGEDASIVQFSRKLDTHLAPPLDTLPPDVATGIISLAARNLTRGATLGLPSGEAVAARMGAAALSADDLGQPGPTPLWFYLLREAHVRGDGGRHLGPVGGRIVAEVLLGLLAHDRLSYLSTDPGWRPFLPREQDDRFTFPDLISFSGYGLDVPPSPF
jgi:hypothetical protein